MDWLGILGIALVVAASVGALVGSFRRGLKNEIIEDQDRRIKQQDDRIDELEKQHKLNKAEIAELRGEIASMQKHFNETAITVIAEGVISLVEKKLEGIK